MNLQSLLLLALVLAVAAFVLYRYVRRQRCTGGCASCGCGCEGCRRSGKR